MNGTFRLFLAFLLILVAAGPVVAADVPQDDLTDPPPAVTLVPTGHQWQPIVGPFADRSGGFEDVVAWRRGFLMTRGSDRTDPEIWRSRDGRRWLSSPAPVPAGNILRTDLWPDGPGLVLVQVTSGSLLQAQTLTFFRSANGRSWNRVGSLDLAVPPALRQCMLNLEGVSRTDRGFVVIADICRSSCCGSITPGVTMLAQSFPSVPGQGGVWTWTSPDGRHWSRTRTAGVGSGKLTAITPQGGGLVAVLTKGTTATLARSADGISWQPIDAIPPEVDTQNEMRIQPVTDGLLFVGDVTDAAGVTSGNVTRVWRVGSDGPWTQVLDLPAAFLTSTTAVGDVVLLAGLDQGRGDGPDFGWTRLSRDAGLTWEKSAGWWGMTDTCFGSMGIRGETAVAATGCSGFGSGAPTAVVTYLDAARPPVVDPLASPTPAPTRPVLAPSLPGPAGTPPTLKTKRRADAIVEQDGVRLELWVPRGTTAVGQWLPAVLRVTNTGSVPLEHAGSVQDLVCHNPTQASLDLSGLWPSIPHQGSAATVADELLQSLTLVDLPPVAGRRFSGSCADIGVTGRLAPGASFMVPMATWARYPLRDQPLPSGTAQVVASYRAGPVGGEAVTVTVSAPVELVGEATTYASPQTLVDAVVTDPSVVAFLVAHPLVAGDDCCDFVNGLGVLFAPLGRTFAEFGYLGGVAPEETIGVSIAGEGGRLEVRLDPWTGTATSWAIQLSSRVREAPGG